MELRKTKINLFQCSRCGEDHKDIELVSFKNPVRNMEMWCMCPVTEEPIIQKIWERMFSESSKGLGDE